MLSFKSNVSPLSFFANTPFIFALVTLQLSVSRWCIFGPTPIPSTAHPTYKHVVLTAVVRPMHCRSDGHVKNSILVHPTYFKLSLGHVGWAFFVDRMGIFRRSDGHFS